MVSIATAGTGITATGYTFPATSETGTTGVATVLLPVIRFEQVPLLFFFWLFDLLLLYLHFLHFFKFLLFLSEFDFLEHLDIFDLLLLGLECFLQLFGLVFFLEMVLFLDLRDLLFL